MRLWLLSLGNRLWLKNGAAGGRIRVLPMQSAEVRFRALATPTSVEDLRRLISKIRTHADAVDERNLTDPEVQSALAAGLAQSLIGLIGHADALPPDGRALLRGAIEYFLLTSDIDDDMTARGMEDDRFVISLACDELGLPQFRPHGS